MAPSTVGSQSKKKLYSRIVQPALPLVPGPKVKTKTEGNPAQPDTNDPAKKPPQLSLTNGVASAVARELAADVPVVRGVTVVEELPVVSNAVASAVEPKADSPPQSTLAPQELAANLPTDSATDEKEAVGATQSVTLDASEKAKYAELSDTSEHGATDSSTLNSHEDSGAIMSYDASDSRSPEAATEPYKEEHRPARAETPATADDPSPHTAADVASTAPGDESSLISQPDQSSHDDSLARVSYDAAHGHPNGTGGSLLGSMTHLTMGPRQYTTIPTLTEYLGVLFQNKDGVDWTIQVNPPIAQPYITYSHSLLLSRSIRLRRLMARQQATGYAVNLINLYPARPIVPQALDAALRFFYTDSVLNENSLPRHDADFQTARFMSVDYVLSYWSAGIELGVEPVAVAAERLLPHHLDWDVLELTFRNATDMASFAVPPNVKNMTGSDYLVASSSIIRLVLQFLTNHLDFSNFKLDTGPSASSVMSRLPQPDEGRHRTNPALASMVFGSMPSSSTVSPSSPPSEILPPASSFQETVASNILLNLDFENLNLFNKFLQARQPSAVTRVMADIITERETRRQRVLNSTTVPNKDRMANSASWEPVGLKESLAGDALTQDHVGFLLSTK